MPKLKNTGERGIKLRKNHNHFLRKEDIENLRIKLIDKAYRKQTRAKFDRTQLSLQNHSYVNSTGRVWTID